MRSLLTILVIAFAFSSAQAASVKCIIGIGSSDEYNDFSDKDLATVSPKQLAEGSALLVDDKKNPTFATAEANFKGIKCTATTADAYGIDDILLKIAVTSADGTKVKVNVNGTGIHEISINDSMKCYCNIAPDAF